MVKLSLKKSYDKEQPAKELKYFRQKRKEYSKCKPAVKIIWNKQVEFLLSLPQPTQLSDEWFAMRKTMLTASDLGKVVEFSSGYNSIIKKKNGLSSFFSNKYTLHGQKYEEIAVQLYSLRHNIKVEELGLIRHHSIPVLGASLDGLRTDGIALEIKCPSGRKINGIIPPLYYAQMQAQMHVCDLDLCDFLECNIIEYPSLSAYKKDMYFPQFVKQLKILPNRFDMDFIKLPDDRRNKLGLEKGIMGHYKVSGGTGYEYIYPPFDVSTDEQLKWLDERRKILYESGYWVEYSYWYLEFSSTQRVKRSDKWWKNWDVENKLYACMKDIKEKGNDKKWMEENKGKDKDEYVDNVPKLEGFAFLDSDEEEEESKPVVNKATKKKKKKKKKKKSNDDENLAVLGGFAFLDSD